VKYFDGVQAYWVSDNYPFDVMVTYDKHGYVEATPCEKSCVRAEVLSATKMVNYLMIEGLKDKKYIGTYIDTIKGLEDEFPEEFI